MNSPNAPDIEAAVKRIINIAATQETLLIRAAVIPHALHRRRPTVLPRRFDVGFGAIRRRAPGDCAACHPWHRPGGLHHARIQTCKRRPRSSADLAHHLKLNS